MGLFSKKAIDGKFDLYSDIESKISHYKRVAFFWTTLFITEFCTGIANLS